jgi:hypothetical protein
VSRINEAKPQTNASKTKIIEPPGREGREVMHLIRIQAFLRDPGAFAVNAFDFQKLDSKFMM